MESAYRLSPELLTAPLQFTTISNHFFHPQPYCRRDACCQWHQSPQGSAKQSADKEDRKSEPQAHACSSFLQHLKRGVEGDGRGRVEEHVGLFAMDGNVGRGALGHGVWRGRDILCFFVFFETLIRIGFDLLRDVSTTIYYFQKHRVLTVSFPRLALGTVN